MTSLVWVLTALAALVIVLTRLRLSSEGSGRFAVSPTLVQAHTVSGAVALASWVVFLVAPEDSFFGGALFGILAVAAWWVVAICGLLILTRWLPSQGRHAPGAAGDTWGEGPGLSMLAHVGLALGVLFFTWAYTFAVV